jgi:hypothetical protein
VEDIFQGAEGAIIMVVVSQMVMVEINGVMELLHMEIIVMEEGLAWEMEWVVVLLVVDIKMEVHQEEEVGAMEVINQQQPDHHQSGIIDGIMRMLVPIIIEVGVDLAVVGVAEVSVMLDIIVLKVTHSRATWMTLKVFCLKMKELNRNFLLLETLASTLINMKIFLLKLQETIVQSI